MKAVDISDWIGKRFGRLVVSSITKTVDSKTACVCYCDCDDKHERPVVVRASDLKRGFKLSCGCMRHDKKPYHGSVTIGQRSGRLEVISLPTSLDDRAPNGDYVCHCKCDCGNPDYVCTLTDIQTQNVKSCGCIDRERLRPIIIGQKFGYLTVVDEVERDPITNRRRYLCSCICGGSKIVSADNLNGGYTTSCGCKLHELQDEYTGRIKIGDVYGRLTVVDIPIEHEAGRTRNVICTCCCGGDESHRVVVNSSNLLSGKVKSCGCLHKLNRPIEEQVLLGKLYGMRRRCIDPKHTSYKYYGAIGVRVCDEWMNDSNAFVKWGLEHGFRLGLTIDRYPNQTGNYEPGNCRFATFKQQNNNKRSNRYVTVGSVTRTFSEWEDKLFISKGTISRKASVCSDEELMEFVADKIDIRNEIVSASKLELEQFCSEYPITIE